MNKLIFIILTCIFTISCGGTTIGNGSESELELGAAGALSADRVETNREAAEFLLQATFGPTLQDIRNLRRLGYSAWFRNQLGIAPDYFLDDMRRRQANGGHSNMGWELHSLEAFLWKASNRSDQLRMRAHYALSQILVTSTDSDSWRRKSQLHGSYKDVMVRNAFGNYRNLLQEVTYHPLMGQWLTYLHNAKADPKKGSAPDENYARELLQLFTIGLSELFKNGEERVMGGVPIEAYTQKDIEELAKVFTGFRLAGTNFGDAVSGHTDVAADTSPMVIDDAWHSEGTKTFLGKTIPEYTDGDKTVAAALDIVFSHPNVGPFISKQLIQRFTTSNPQPNYVKRVATAFNSGRYTLPDGSNVGSGKRGDLVPVWAAILFDAHARSEGRLTNTKFGRQWGKVREPAIRMIHWMRVAGISGYGVRNFATLEYLGQTPYRASSVFNFYRPGYVAPSTSTADAGLTAPELQIATGPNLINYIDSTRRLMTGSQMPDGNFTPVFARERELAHNPTRLLNYVDLVYTAYQLTDKTRELIYRAIREIELPAQGVARNAALRRRAEVATLLTMTAPEFITQR